MLPADELLKLCNTLRQDVIRYHLARCEAMLRRINNDAANYVTKALYCLGEESK